MEINAYSSLNYSLFSDSGNQDAINNILLNVQNTEEITDEFRNTIKVKYSTEVFNITVDSFKKELIKLNTLKNELEQEYSEKKGAVDKISGKVQELVDCIVPVEAKTYIEDYSFKELLYSKIVEYSMDLGVESTKEKLINVKKELACLKDSINSFNSIQHPCICTICMEFKLEYFIDPCGHTLCKNCKEKLNNKCFYCRNKITGFKKLFLFDS